MTFIAALRYDGLTAPCVFDGPINAVQFRAYGEQIFLPKLKPRGIVIMDNLRSHKALVIRDIIRNVGTPLQFLPPYSPDFIPIEQNFSKINHWMQMAAKGNTRMHGELSENLSDQSLAKNAKTTLKMLDMLPLKNDVLQIQRSLRFQACKFY